MFKLVICIKDKVIGTNSHKLDIILHVHLATKHLITFPIDSWRNVKRL